MSVLQTGSSGPGVAALQQLLRERGFDDPGEVDGQFGEGTNAAVRAFQTSVGFQADGQAGPNTLAALEKLNVTSNVSAALIAPLFPAAPLLNIRLASPRWRPW
jgi:peptidoglycan L-alanyl-D-glutamate endopeptidase CwlK